MARVLLISYAGTPALVSSLYPDNGLASLAAVLLRAGHTVKVLDFNTVSTLARTASPGWTAALRALMPEIQAGGSAELLPRLTELQSELEDGLRCTTAWMGEIVAEETRAFGASLVGFKLWSGDGFLASAEIARVLRQRQPGIRLVGGGPAVLYSEHAVFDLAPDLDALVDGEGEQSILGLARWSEGLLDLRSIPNLIVREGSAVRRTPRSEVQDLSQLPPPAYSTEIYPSLAGDDHLKLFILDESRGCPMGCAFCVHRHASGEKWRVQAADRVADVMSSLRGTFGATGFRLGGSCTPASFYKRLAEQVESRRLAVRLSGFGHAGGMPGEVIESLARVGCASLFFGVESFDGQDLRRLGKQLQPDTVLETVRRCQQHDIVPILSLIVPLPAQTEAARERNVRCALECQARVPAPVQVTIPGLVPRSPWWDSREQYGFVLQGDEDAYRRLLLSYKIRHLLPSSLWEPLPYFLDGLDYAGYARISFDFQRRLAREGIVVNVSDDVVLLANALGMELAALRLRMQELFLCLDVQGLAELVAAANRILAPGDGGGG